MYEGKLSFIGSEREEGDSKICDIAHYFRSWRGDCKVITKIKTRQRGKDKNGKFVKKG